MHQGDRLEEIRGYFGLKNNAFADKIGISAQSYNNYKRNVRSIPVEVLQKIKEVFNISVEWVLTGNGHMLAGELGNYSNSSSVKVNIIKAGAGTAILNYEDDEEMLSFPRKFLSFNVKDGEHLTAVEIDGDSMYPTLSHGNYVLLDSTEQFQNNGIYCINLNGWVQVKRLYYNPIENKLTIISDNSNYPDQVLSCNIENDNRIKILGKIKGLISQV